MEKEIKIIAPDGYEIDKEHSTLECIKFKQKRKPSLSDAVDALGSRICGRDIEIEKRYIKIPLPNCNKEWTFEAFEWAKDFCRIHEGCYPEHAPTFHHDLLYINCDCEEFF
jgi:hypothetical protein